MKKYFLVIIAVFMMFGIVACNSTEESEVVMSLNAGVDTVEINSTYTDPGATALVGEESLTVEVSSNTVDITVLGTYSITYTTTYLEEDYEITRYIHVVDETAPVLTIVAGVDTLFVGGEWQDAGVLVSDNSLETISYSVSGTVDTSLAGTYTIDYTATDSSGNETTVSRIVTVISVDE